MQSYRNLMLSYRGSERQPPNTLQLALRFSQIMDLRDQEKVHAKTLSTQDRLDLVIDEYHRTSGLQMKHKVDEDRAKSCYNIIAGTCKAAANHLSACSLPMKCLLGVNACLRQRETSSACTCNTTSGARAPSAWSSFEASDGSSEQPRKQAAPAT